MNQTKKGFTIIEISLAIAFFSVLLITIAILTITILSIYRKGLSIKSVNVSGRSLIDQFSRSISSSPAKSAATDCTKLPSNSHQQCLSDGAYKLIYSQTFGQISLPKSTLFKSVPAHGAFCTGRYSYLWNTGYTFDQFNPDIKKYNIRKAELKFIDKNGNTRLLNNFRLIRVEDSSREICRSRLGGGYSYNPGHTYQVLEQKQTSDPVELLSSAEEDLALYDLKIFKPAEHRLTRHSFYSGTFILATIRGGVNITGVGDYCTEPPDKLNTDFAYCAINKFNFAIRATGELTNEEKQKQAQ